MQERRNRNYLQRMKRKTISLILYTGYICGKVVIYSMGYTIFRLSANFTQCFENKLMELDHILHMH